MHWTLGLLLQILISLVFLPLPKIGAKKKGGKKIGEMLWQFKYLLCDIHPTIHYNMHTNIFEIIIIIDNLLFLAFCLSYFKSIVLVLVLLLLLLLFFSSSYDGQFAWVVVSWLRVWFRVCLLLVRLLSGCCCCKCLVAGCLTAW